MDIWIIALVMGVVAMVVGPLMMLRPDPAQRRQARIREQAFRLGVQVQMLPLPSRATDTAASGLWPAYCLPLPRAGGIQPWNLRRSIYDHELNFLDAWNWDGPPAPPAEQVVLREWLPKLPPSVVAVSAGVKGWCFYWDERGGETVLEQLRDALQALALAANQNAVKNNEGIQGED